MPIVIYRNPKEKRNHSWVRYLLARIRNNQNNLITVVGKTGSGKTWSAISICELISKKNKTEFTVENIIFSLKDLMQLINSGKLKKGSSIVFDEPQISISSREFQSEANKVFNYLLTTFRHRNLSLFFCTPFEDLLDKTARKLFHAKFLTMSVNRNSKTCKLKPVVTEYNSHLEKWYEKFLRVTFKVEGKEKFEVRKLKHWDVPKPSEEIIKLYEDKKLAFTNKLNTNIEQRLNSYELRQQAKLNVKPINLNPLTPKQQEAYDLMIKYQNETQIAKILGIDISSVSQRLALAKKKGFNFREISNNPILVQH